MVNAWLSFLEVRDSTAEQILPNEISEICEPNILRGYISLSNFFLTKIAIVSSKYYSKHLKNSSSCGPFHLMSRSKAYFAFLYLYTLLFAENTPKFLR
jgi:hypothetical protein